MNGTSGRVDNLVEPFLTSRLPPLGVGASILFEDYCPDIEMNAPLPLPDHPVLADEIRDVQRATWAGLSAGWEKWDSVIMEQLGPVGAAVIERLDIAGDDEHLDIPSGTGRRDVAEWDVDVELVTRSPAQYWEMISEHVSLAVAALQQVDELARERIRASAIAKVGAFEKDGKVRVPGVARCIVGTKQDASA